MSEHGPDYWQALRDLAHELDEAVNLERERLMINFPDVEDEWLLRTAHTSIALKKLAWNLRKRAEAQS